MTRTCKLYHYYPDIDVTVIVMETDVVGMVTCLDVTGSSSPARHQQQSSSFSGCVEVETEVTGAVVCQSARPHTDT